MKRETDRISIYNIYIYIIYILKAKAYNEATHISIA